MPRGPGLRSTASKPRLGLRAARSATAPPTRPATPQAGPPAPASLPAPLRAAALLGLALLAAAPPAQAAKPVLRTTNPVTTSGSQVTLHYDQTLASGKTPFNAQFTVTVGGQTVTTRVP